MNTPIPTGWKPMPQVLTEKMHGAAVRTIINCTGNDDWPPAVYAAFLKHAPTPPASAQDDAKDERLFDDEAHVLVPIGLLGAACSAIDKKRDAPKTLAKLRRYTTGDLSSRHVHAPAAGDALEVDPLQGAAVWLMRALGGADASTLQSHLVIGYNRAQRLYDAALAAQVPRSKGGEA